MKTKELVRQLLLTDPDGEAEVCVGNIDIIDVDGPMPCYYDGQFVQIVLDEESRTENNCHGVIKVKPRTKGNKIKLRTMDAEEAFLENPEAILEMDPYNPNREKEWLETVEKWREEGRQLRKQLDQMREEHKEKLRKEGKKE